MHKVAAQKPAAPVRKHRDIATVYKDKLVEIDSDEKLTRKQAKAIAQRVEAAYERDAFEQGIPLPRGGRIDVGVFSAKTFAELTGDTRGQVFGQTQDKNTILLRDGIARGGGSAGDKAVLAHELGHIQDFRAAGKRIAKVPSFVQEGKEILLGDLFDASRGVKNPGVAESAKALGRYTARDAEQVLKNFRGDERPELRRGNAARDERIGALYVEFLRTRFNGGSPQAIQKLAQVTAAVGKGQGYAQAFTQAFGVSPAQSEQAFVAFMRQTEGDPKARLAGTIYAH